MHSRNYLPAVLTALTSLSFANLSWAENEIGYIEKFALAADREKVLGELVPGSEDYYFFHALHYQNTRNEPKLAEILDQWRKRFPNDTPRRRTIEHREALLDYDATPQQTLDYLKDRLRVQFNHQQEARDRKPNLPTTLDAARIARDVFLKDTVTHDNDLSSLTVDELETLVTSKVALTPQQRRAILSRLQRPDVPGLVDFIAEEMRMKDTPGFGGFPIHRALLLEQLDALEKAFPVARLRIPGSTQIVLATNETYVHTRMRKLAPSADVDVEFDVVEREAWLERVWAYVQTLPPAFNTLKARVLFLRLDHDRKKGVYDAARFKAYLSLPRQMNYVNPRWLQDATQRQPAADLNVDLSEPLLAAPPIGNDEELVREYFLALFDRAAAANPLGEGMMEPYLELVRDTWLKPVLAEALIVGGHGNPERWAYLLTPTAFQALKDRVDIEFPKTNSQFFAPGADVAFDVTVKNTPKLLVKIYEVNTLNFFLTQKRQLNTDLNLDGLVANSEETRDIEIGPFKRARQNFQFPALKGRRGAWIIEFIGGGRSSRALVRVGQWQALQRTGPSGDLLTVIDEAGQPVKDAVIWLDGRRHAVDPALDAIPVPFTANPGMRPIVLASGDGTFATLTQFDHHGENYALDAQFHIEREQLLAGRSATLAARVSLLLGETHLDPALLKETRLLVTSTTIDGISTTREFRDPKLGAGGVLTQEITLPERAVKLAVTLSGKVDALSNRNEKRDLSASHAWDINGIDRTEATNDGHLAKFVGNYAYELLGKNGEPLADQQVVFTIKHRGFERPQTIALKTDEKGRIGLGALHGIKRFTAKAPNGREASWTLDEFERTWTSVVHTGAGQAIRIPAPPQAAGAADALRREVSLLQQNAGTFTVDHSAKIKLEAGFLVIEDLAPGDYSLRLRGQDREIAIKVSGGKASRGWYLGSSRNLEAKAEAPLQITAVTNDQQFVIVKLANVNPFTRVHVAATRFEPGRGLFAGLANFNRFGAASGAPARLPNLYSAGRSIGDEYRYILERRHTKTYPGNMLTRPGLLLNPWEIRDTGLTELAQQAGQAAGSTRGGRGDALQRRLAEPAAVADPQSLPGGAAADTNLDFLGAPAPVLYNLIPEKDGTVKIAREALGDRQHVQVYAEDLANAVWQSFALPETATKFTDQRLTRNLDPAKKFAQKKEVAVLEAAKSITLADIQTSEIETYDTLAGIHSLFSTLNPEPKLVEFAWILQWPKLKDDERRSKYSEYACHELNFFLARKDPGFFDQVIKPYLANKKDKTLMDEFLIGADLTRYLEQTEYARLNSLERALLAQRIKETAANVSRNLRELWELVPPNPELEDRFFETALRGRAMEGGESGEGVAARFKREQLGESLSVAGKLATATGAAPSSPAPAPPAAAATPLAAAAPMPAMRPAQPAGGAGIDAVELKAQKGVAFTEADLRQLAEREVLGDELRGRPELEKKLKDAQGRDRAMRGFAGRDGAADAKQDFAYFGRDAADKSRGLYRAMYRQLGATKEWAENNYYKLRITEQNAALVPVNGFWRDYAKWIADGSQGAFVSKHVAEAHRNFTEMMLALAVLDLPFDAPKHTTKADAGQFTLTAGGPAIVFHKQIKPAQVAAADEAQGKLLVSQSFFRHGDRHRQEGNEKIEKYVTAEFLTGAVYGANVVVTNPTSAPVKAEVLLQIPNGALPVLGSKSTDSRRVRLEPYTTKTFEYHFYFPAAGPDGGKFPHFPVNVAVTGAGGKEGPVASAEAFSFNVVTKLTEIDKASWDYVSQYGTDAEVFAFLEQNNLAAINVERVAWRCRDAAFFRKFVAFLRQHHVWNETIYSYALMHNDPAALREWIKRKDDFVSQCGPWLATKLVLLDPIDRRTYEHLEYSPLVNQRAHRLGKEWRVANPAIRQQYQSYLNVIAHKPQLEPMDQLSVSYYLFLQDRVDEALGRFRAVDPNSVPTKIQHDYLRSYANLYEGNLAEARGVVSNYANYPVDRWRIRFADIRTQLDEIEGKAANVEKGNQPDREKQQSELTATEPSFDFKVENRNLALTWQNLGEVTINYYLMDPEFSFSSNPFVSEDASRFSIIKPSRSAKQELPKDRKALEIPLPPEFARANVLVEVVAAGERKAQAYHANTMKVTVTENYGRIEARDSANDRALPKAYVKVYARLNNGTVRFFKDGYTDLRGRFDYASLNGGGSAEVPPPVPVPMPRAAAPATGLDYQMLKPAELPQVDKLAILVLSDTNGATTREVNPPRD